MESLEVFPIDEQSTGEVDPDPAGDEESGSSGGDATVVDVSRKEWEISLFDRPPPSDAAAEVLYVYQNTFHLVPRAVGRFKRLKTLKFFANEIEVLPPEAGDMVDLESLQVKVSSPSLSDLPLQKMKSLKELELCRAPPRPSALSILTEITALKHLTKLSICHFSIRYLPPEISCLKKLEELDLSFNKLKKLPSDIASLSTLKSLRVANNKLTDLPSGISSLRRLENLDVSNNRLTSLTSLDLDSMHTLQYLNLQHNKLLSRCQIPSWIYCNLEGSGEDIANNDMSTSIVEVELYDVAVPRVHGSRSCNGCHSTSSCLHLETSLGCRQRLKKVWKRRDYLQQRARQERLYSRRMWRGEGNNANITVKMAEENDSCESVVENENPEFQFDVYEEKISDSSAKSSFQLENKSGAGEDDACVGARDSASISHSCTDSEKSHGGCSCSASKLALNKYCKFEHDIENHPSACSSNELSFPNGNSSSETSKHILKSKRHSDKDLDSPKPSKFRRPVNEYSKLSFKYSSESFCSIEDHLPDGFYDAGRDRPFMSLQDYERSLCLDSREVILLDREMDEELDAIAFSAQRLLSNWKSSCSNENKEVVVDNLQRASILALFVSDCFGGSDRSASVMRTRRAVVGSHKQQPFVCTCSDGSVYGNGQGFKQTYVVGSPNFTDLCEKSLRLIKGTLNSNVVPIGTLRFGVCRHRAVLMKYLCDRAVPPIPCELVRGYLDFMPHAWNTIHVRRGNEWARMVVDACYPTDIREEADLEYFSRYIPLSRLHVPLTESDPISGCFILPPSLNCGTEKRPSCFVTHCKFGTLDAAIKVRSLEAYGASDEEIRSFEYTFLGEVRIMGALKKHSCIAEIYGHQLSSKWVPPDDGNKESRVLQSIIIMEYVRGGSLKSYLEKLSKAGEKNVPVDIALCIARDVAWALVEVHSKHIIHRDLKSENILIDLDCKRTDGSPTIKLSDFDRSVPLWSSIHTCCNSHLGIHPPDVCVGTPRWMAPEVVQAMHQRNPYGLEVDIWSYGCLLLELLTLKFPYMGHSDAEIYDLLQRKQRPILTPELEALAQLDEPGARSESGSSPDAEADITSLLVDLFYQCTEGNPVDRPTARRIYEKLCAVPRQPLCSDSAVANNLTQLLHQNFVESGAEA